jgi:ABC-2 type transport system ATP-binding protein
VIRDVSLALHPGEWCVLLGPNGCGKTTFLDCLAGRLAPLSGEVLINGSNLAADPYAAKSALGYACAPELLPPLLTARQCLEVIAAAKNVAAVDTGVMELAEHLNFLPYLDQFVDTLSLGTRQKLAVLACLVGRPSLVVLDEAFNGLDAGSAGTLKRYLEHQVATKQIAVLLATHALDIVERYATRAMLLCDGVLVRQWDRAQIEAARGGFDLELASHFSADR